MIVSETLGVVAVAFWLLSFLFFFFDVIEDSSASSSSSSDEVSGEESYSHASAKAGWKHEDTTVTLRGFQRTMVKSITMAAKDPHFYYVEEIRCTCQAKSLSKVVTLIQMSSTLSFQGFPSKIRLAEGQQQETHDRAK